MPEAPEPSAPEPYESTIARRRWRCNGVLCRNEPACITHGDLYWTAKVTQGVFRTPLTLRLCNECFLGENEHGSCY